MRWIKHAWTMRFPGRSHGERLPEAPPRQEVEQIEARLCLGTLNSPPLGDMPGVTEDYAALNPDWVEVYHAPDDVSESPHPDSNEIPASGDDHGSEPAAVVAETEGVGSTSDQSAPGQTDVSVGSGINDTLLGDALPSAPLADTDTSTSATQTVSAGHPNSAGTSVVPPTNSSQSTAAGESSDAAPAAGQPVTTESTADNSIDADTLSSLGFTLDADGNATGLCDWWNYYGEPIVVRYDFRDIGEHQNEITDDQKDRALDALSAWTEATGGKIQFVRDTTAADSEVLNIGTGDLAAFGTVSGADGTLGVGGGELIGSMAAPSVAGVAWLDRAENWDVEIGNGNPEGTYDYFTVVAHETGHALGFIDQYNSNSSDIMNGIYDVERSADAVQYSAETGNLRRTFFNLDRAGDYDVAPMMMGFPQLVEAEVAQLLNRASAASASDDAIIAVVDRGGNILGVRVEQQALANLPDQRDLIFAIDGAIAKARTAAFFSNGDPDNGTLAPLTSRLVQFISQSTVTQREVESNPNSELNPVTFMQTVAQVNASTTYGPGTVAPIGLGAHFPPGVEYTPPVDLFAIEHTNRDTRLHPGPDGIKGSGDDILLPSRFNVNPLFIPPDPQTNTPGGQATMAPESYGFVSGRIPTAQARGIATLPGGIPIFRDTNNDGVGETLVGGIGVFFPGTTGFASFEQGFQQGTGQTTLELLNAQRVLEAEYIAYAAVGGSNLAQQQGINGARIDAINGVARVDRIDLPFGRLDLVGINLPVLGPTAGPLGLQQLIAFGNTLGAGNPNSGANQPLNLGGNGIVDPNPNAPIDDVFFAPGQSVAEGTLVTSHDSPTGLLTAQDVDQIINAGRQAAELTRAAVRLPVSSRTRMVFAVADLNGEILGLFRMQDATFFSIDVAVAKSRNVAYYADATTLQAFDQVVQPGAALTNRSFRFLSGPRYPDGIDREAPGPFSILNHPNIDPLTGENVGGPAAAGTFDPAVNPNTASVLGFDSFFPNTNFQDPNNPENQNGIVFFPGSIPLYKNGQLVGGLGVSGDGVDQDDVVTFLASAGFGPPTNLKADSFFFRDVRLPGNKFLRNPFG